MDRYNTSHDFMKGAFLFSLLALVGSFLSIINAIPIMISYQFLHDARQQGLSQKHDKIISYILEFSLILTLCITILYFNIQW